MSVAELPFATTDMQHLFRLQVGDEWQTAVSSLYLEL